MKRGRERERERERERPVEPSQTIFEVDDLIKRRLWRACILLTVLFPLLPPLFTRLFRRRTGDILLLSDRLLFTPLLFRPRIGSRFWTRC
jgi:hypothetical protein